MKVVILAGGYGTRLSELTNDIPKPMVEIGGYPILWHIMNVYASQGFNEFVIALGYKANVVKKFFHDYYLNHSDLIVNLNDGSMQYIDSRKLNWKVTLVDTGLDSMTGGRIKRLTPYLQDQFMLTYGDGLSNVNLHELLDSHNKSKKEVTLTTIHPTSKYGKLEIAEDGSITRFIEKPEFGGDWINGGYFVMEPEFISRIENDQTVLEREPLESACVANQLNAFKHSGFWHCMDTLRDRNELNDMWRSGNPPWKVW
ncbi:MAG: glucose-1-phosphate cytidylyltransferase [Polynucleobacter sp.]|nr:glucose-1-phosphate cytidylyltransferase [Polynucleobacter sp.]